MSEFSELAKLGAAAPTNVSMNFTTGALGERTVEEKRSATLARGPAVRTNWKRLDCAGALYSDSPSAAAFTRRSRAASASVSIKVRLSSQPMQASVML